MFDVLLYRRLRLLFLAKTLLFISMTFPSKPLLEIVEKDKPNNLHVLLTTKTFAFPFAPTCCEWLSEAWTSPSTCYLPSLSQGSLPFSSQLLKHTCLLSTFSPLLLFPLHQGTPSSSSLHLNTGTTCPSILANSTPSLFHGPHSLSCAHSCTRYSWH